MYTIILFVAVCYIIVLLCLAVMVFFSQSTYGVNEGAGRAQLVLVLSNPSSTDIAVQVRDTQKTATSE